MLSIRNRQARNRFQPQFEALEDRQLLAASAVFNAGVITIQGTKKADSVSIVDQGNLDGAKVTVRVEGQQVLQVNGKDVSAINFKMGKGNDFVGYDQTGKVLFGERTITGDLGQGNDTFLGYIKEEIRHDQIAMNVKAGDGNDSLKLSFPAGYGVDIGTQFDCTLDGGKGNDKLSVDALNLLLSSYSAQANISMLGGVGNDAITANFAGTLFGGFAFKADGGKDRDIISATFSLDAASGYYPDGKPSGATLDAQVLGGKGNDSLSLQIVNKSTAPMALGGLVDGGPEKDTCTTTGSTVPIIVVSCP